MGALPDGPEDMTDGFGVRIIAEPGEVELLQFPPLPLGEDMAALRVTVRADQPGAAVAFVGLDGSMDGSIATNIPQTATFSLTSMTG